MKWVALRRAAGAVALCLLARHVHADPTRPEASSAQLAAEVLFIDGVKLMKDGLCAEAIVKFRESQRLDAASGTLLNLAYCELQLGRPSSAWLTYRQALALAQTSQKALHAQIAQQQAEKLERELPRLVLTSAGSEPRELVVELDGLPLTRPVWSLSIPVDPGEHSLSATLEDGKVWRTTFGIAPGERVAIDIPRPAPSLSSAATKPRAAAHDRSRAAAPTARPPGPTWALGVAVTGAAAFTASVALFVSARVSYDAAKEHCRPGNACYEPYYGAERDAIGRMRLSLVLGASGLVLGGVGSWLYWAPPRNPSSARASLSAFISPVGAAIRGAF